MKFLFFSIVLILFLFSTGLLSQSSLKLVEAKAEPEEASLGDTVQVTVEFVGEKNILEKVFLRVREYPYDYPDIILNPVENENNKWTASGIVPYDAPYQEFHLDITAIDTTGNKMAIENCPENEQGCSIKLKVKD